MVNILSSIQRSALIALTSTAMLSAPFAANAAAAWVQQAYLKASNTDPNDAFGWCVAVSGGTVLVGAYEEDSNATGVNGDPFNNLTSFSGAAYVYVRNGASWVQQAYLKASNTGGLTSSFDEFGDGFGWAVAISGDTIVIGAPQEDSSATGVNGNQSDNSTLGSGAAYVFVREGTNWHQQAYLKASNSGSTDIFGVSVAISGDTIVVGAVDEDSNATGVNGAQNNNSTMQAGAAYVFVREGSNWIQQAYLKASNTPASGQSGQSTEERFGYAVAVSGDTVVVGAMDEDSAATGVNGDQFNNAAPNAGAAYVFVREGTNWSQQAYLKASNTGAGDQFGWSVSVSGDTIVVGAQREDSSATGVNGNQSNNTSSDSGAAYVFVRAGTNWAQQAYLKASNTGAMDRFGTSVSISGDTVVVGSGGFDYINGVGGAGEDSNATGVDGDQGNNSAVNSGAAYVFRRTGTNWSQSAYIKASNTSANDYFGRWVSVSGENIAIGAPGETSNTTGVNGDQANNSAFQAGATYVFANLSPADPELSLVSNRSGGYLLSFNGVPGRSYHLQRAQSLFGPWETLTILTAPPSGLVQYEETAPLENTAFYRTDRP